MALALHKKILNALENGPLKNEELYALMPEEKRISIRAIITLHPELFLRIANGIVGRKGRDEHLIKFYEPIKQPKQKKITTAYMIKCFLAEGPKTLKEIYTEFPDLKKKSITCKLALDKEIIRIDKETYAIQGGKNEMGI